MCDRASILAHLQSAIGGVRHNVHTKPVCMQSRDRKNFTFWRVKCNLSCSSNCIPVSVWHSKWLVARVHSRFSIEMHQMLSQENNRIPYNRAYSFVISWISTARERESFSHILSILKLIIGFGQQKLPEK